MGQLRRRRRITRPETLRAPLFPLTEVVGWYRYDYGQIKDATGTTTLSYWEDQSGLGNHFEQLNKVNQPTYSGGVITFNGVDQFMSMVSGSTLFKNTALMGAAIVASVPSDQSTKFLFFASTGDSTTNARFGMYLTSGTKVTTSYRELDADSGASQTYSSGTFTTGQYALHTGYVDFGVANVRKIRLNGAEKGTGTAKVTPAGLTSNTNSQSILLGCSTGANFAAFSVKEIVLFRGVTTLSAIEGNLNSRFTIY